MPTRQRIGTDGPGGAGGGGGPAPAGNLIVGPDYGNPPECQIHVSCKLAALQLAYSAGSPKCSVAMPSIVLAGLAAGSPKVSCAGRADVTQRAGGNVAINDGPDNFTNPNNAVGLINGTEATRAGSPTGAINAALRLQYLNTPAWLTSFTIDFVMLRFSFAQSGVVLGNGGLGVDYRTAAGGAWTNVLTTSSNNDSITIPLDLDITAIIGQDFSKLDNLETRVTATLPIASTATIRVDAIELHADYVKDSL